MRKKEKEKSAEQGSSNVRKDRSDGRESNSGHHLGLAATHNTSGSPVPVPLVDALCHLELFASDDDRAHTCAAAAAHGVGTVVSAGTDPSSDERLPPTCLRVHRAYGIHPQHANDERLPGQLEALKHRLDNDDVVALGECGLDHRPGMPPHEVQERTFRAQLELARRRQLPVILHIVRAHARALDVLEEVMGKAPLPAGGVWHAFAGPIDAVERGLRLGLFFSVGALINNPGARRLQQAVPQIPAERLLVETDAPHAALSALPAHLETLAKVREVSVDTLALSTAAAARAVYRLA